MTLLGFLLSALATTALSLVSFVVRPVAATCPPRWALLTGVQRDGSFTCWLDHDTEDWPAIDKPHEAVIGSRIWCSSEEQPRQDGARVWCAAGRAGS